MRINEFIGKYQPLIDPDRTQEFAQDFWAVVEKLGEGRFRNVAIEVLSSLKNSDLIMKTRGDYGYIIWGHKGEAEETGFMLTYPDSLGQQESDWFTLMRVIAEKALKQS